MPPCMIVLTDADISRFWSNVQCGEADVCWPFLGSQAKDGYCHFSVGPGERFPGSWKLWKTYLAHRVAYAAAHGGTLDGGTIRHSCDSTSCCNPAHLIYGTQAENMADMVARGRRRGIVVAIGRKKISDEQVALLRELARAPGANVSAVARSFGVSRKLVRSIRDGHARLAVA